MIISPLKKPVPWAGFRLFVFVLANFFIYTGIPLLGSNKTKAAETALVHVCNNSTSV
jgi:hypothetical protein